MNFGSAAVIGVPREKNRTESLSGKIVGGSEGPRSQQGKGRIDSTKKQRGERVIIENENSRSSIESDPRSSNFLFMQGVSSVSSNGKQSGRRSMNFDGADSTEGNGSGQNNGYGEENAGQTEDLSHDDLAAGISWKWSAKKSENHHTEQEPLMNSILSLQLVQDALEKEIQKFGEVGNDLKSVLGHQSNDAAADFTSTKLEARELSSSVENGSDINRQNSSRSLQTKAVNLTDDVKLLESKLEEARNMLEAKESRVAELETILNLSKSVKEDSVSMQQENCQEFETELEGLFRQRIEVEVEYLAIMNTIQKMKLVALSYNTVVKGNINQAREQELVADKLEEAKGKALELEKWCEDIMGTKEIINVQRKVCKATSCFFIQLILVILVVRLFILQLKLQSGAFVPT